MQSRLVVTSKLPHFSFLLTQGETRINLSGTTHAEMAVFPKIWAIIQFFGFALPAVFADGAKPLIFATVCAGIDVGMAVAHKVGLLSSFQVIPSD